MAENEGGITVPVRIERKKDVTIKEKHSKVSVVFLNSKGHSHMLPEDMALNQEKSHRGHIIDKSHKNYMRLFKMACGYDEKIGTNKFSQSAGKVSSIEATGRIDMEALVAKENIEAEKAKKDAGNK